MARKKENIYERLIAIGDKLLDLIIQKNAGCIVVVILCWTGGAFLLLLSLYIPQPFDWWIRLVGLIMVGVGAICFAVILPVLIYCWIVKQLR